MIFNFGSINIDKVYRVKSAPKPGETIHSLDYSEHMGGKGFNQSVAAHFARGTVLHAGYVGRDDAVIKRIKKFGLNTTEIRKISAPTGHAIIIVDAQGENEIILHGGANNAFTIEDAAGLLAQRPNEDHWVVLQNEINLSAQIAALAKQTGYRVCYSAAPFDIEAVEAILPNIDLLAVNETELAALLEATGQSLADLEIPMILVTLGAKGAQLHQDGQVITQSGHRVDAVDTTGAGDTFLGSFLARLDIGGEAEQALNYAAAAAAIQVTREGAATAIPNYNDVSAFIGESAL